MMIKLYLLDCSNLNGENQFNKYYNIMSPYRQNKIDRLKPRKSKNLSLGAGILLDNYLKQLGISEREMTYFTKGNGKPFFSSLPNAYFSLSHSGDVAICTFSDNEVGCDIEQIDKPTEGIAKRFFTQSEYKYIFDNTTELQQLDRFYRIWTLKESYLKLTGKGLGGGLDSFSVSINNQGRVVIIDNSIEENSEKGQVFFKEYTYPQYKIAVCSNYDSFNDEIITVEL